MYAPFDKGNSSNPFTLAIFGGIFGTILSTSIGMKKWIRAELCFEYMITIRALVSNFIKRRKSHYKWQQKMQVEACLNTVDQWLHTHLICCIHEKQKNAQRANNQKEYTNNQVNGVQTKSFIKLIIPIHR